MVILPYNKSLLYGNTYVMVTLPYEPFLSYYNIKLSYAIIMWNGKVAI